MERSKGLSRRRLLSLAPAVAGLAACGPTLVRPRVDVRDYGAVGDGVTDDSQALRAAAAALRPGHTLYFPNGSYRFAELRPASRAAITITAISDVAVEFDVTAELLMDNLEEGMGTTHGILVRGPVTGITFRNVRIRWKTQPAARSQGDGIRIVGYPAEHFAPLAGWTGSQGTVNGVRILDCEVRSSPQAGVLMIGASDIVVDGLLVQDTLADGLHFNACRRARIKNHTAVNTGDDGLALVTYYAEEFSFNPRAQTFAFPDLNDWSDADFSITNVSISGGGANGVRLAGTHRVNIRSLSVSGKGAGAGIIVDSAAPGVDAGWHYVASNTVTAERVLVEDCSIGLHLLARPDDAADRRFADFGFDATHVKVRHCSQWAVRAESMTVLRTSGLRMLGCEVEAASTVGGNGGVGLANLANPRLEKISISHPDPVTLFSVNGVTGLVVDKLRMWVGRSGESDNDASPCALLENSDGRIDRITIRRPGAPRSWHPIQMVGTDTACIDSADQPPIALSALTVDPPVSQPVAVC